MLSPAWSLLKFEYFKVRIDFFFTTHRLRRDWTAHKINLEKLLLWLIALQSTSLWSQKLWEALTHRGLPGCLPIWLSLALATTLHYKSREQTQGYWVGQGVGFWVGCCSISSADPLKSKFQRQTDLLDLVDGWGCARIIRRQNNLINKK